MTRTEEKSSSISLGWKEQETFEESWKDLEVMEG